MFVHNRQFQDWLREATTSRKASSIGTSAGHDGQEVFYAGSGLQHGNEGTRRIEIQVSIDSSSGRSRHMTTML